MATGLLSATYTVQPTVSAIAGVRWDFHRDL